MHSFFLVLLGATQALYLFGLVVVLWLYARPVDLVQLDGDTSTRGGEPAIILFYPVLRELEETMRTTFTGMTRAHYPRDRLRVVAIPNHDDEQSIAALYRLQAEFDFLEVMPVPATSDPSWRPVWSSWDMNPKSYWWHVGKRAGETALPPKKTRQLIWATYQLGPDNPDALLSYIDADSVVPEDYFRGAAVGMRHYDVIQYTNITGNLLQTQASSLYAMDHICWDASLYKHMTAHGRHPFYVLGKGLFFRFRDVLEVGGFHPWLTIEDPEIGLRLWTNGARLGVVESPLIEEVPLTFTAGVVQRKRWIAGFFQTLGSPLTHMGMTARARWRARLNLVPTLTLLVNPFGFVIGTWALIGAITSSTTFVPSPLQWLCILTLFLTALIVGYGQRQAWRMSKPVLPRKRDRVRFLFRVNPLFLFIYWLWWTIPIVIGLWMYLTDGGLVWVRTTKVDANSALVRGREFQRNAGVNAAIAGPVHSEPSGSGPVK